jgi:predicted RNase H-like HicB family nuclease
MPEEDGTFAAEILEFPGCVAQGETAESALAALEEAATGWLQAALEEGQEVPEPMDIRDYSGRIALRLPRGLHKRAAQLAERENTSVTQWIVAAIAERTGAHQIYGNLVNRFVSLAHGAAQQPINLSIVFPDLKPDERLSVSVSSGASMGSVVGRPALGVANG